MSNEAVQRELEAVKRRFRDYLEAEAEWQQSTREQSEEYLHSMIQSLYASIGSLAVAVELLDGKP